MRITKITTNNFTSSSKPQETSDKNSTDVLKMFHDKAKNSADMTDSILVPRTIFKGYLGIMTGTTLLTLSSFTSKFSKISKSLGILGALTSLYGTWAFVRPFIVKDAKGVQTTKDVEKA